MRRISLRLAVAAALIGAGWSAGRAQTRVADFEIAIDAPRGDVSLTCYRGCDWPREAGNRVPATSFRCETERCRATFNGHGRIRLEAPEMRQPR